MAETRRHPGFFANIEEAKKYAAKHYDAVYKKGRGNNTEYFVPATMGEFTTAKAMGYKEIK